MQTAQTVAVEIVDEVEAGYMLNEYTSGVLTGYTLRRGNEFVSCDEVLIMEEDEDLSYVFEEWKQFALDGYEGYKYWTATTISPKFDK